MRSQGSLITVVLKVQEPELSKQIWDHHLNGTLVMGCNVQGIADGSLLEDRDLIEKYEEYIRGHVKDYNESDFDSFDTFVDKLQEKKKKMDEPAGSSTHH